MKRAGTGGFEGGEGAGMCGERQAQVPSSNPAPASCRRPARPEQRTCRGPSPAPGARLRSRRTTRYKRSRRSVRMMLRAFAPSPVIHVTNCKGQRRYARCALSETHMYACMMHNTWAAPMRNDAPCRHPQPHPPARPPARLHKRRQRSQQVCHEGAMLDVEGSCGAGICMGGAGSHVANK